MKKQSLYDINQEQLNLIAEIESLEGEITPEMEAKLTITKGQLDQKSVAYTEVIKTKDAMNGLIDQEIKRLQGLKKVNNNTVRRLKDNLLTAVKTFGSYQVGTLTFGTRKSTSVEVDTDMVNSLPEKYKTIKVTESANKTEIKKALQAGDEIDGCRLVENLNLTIK